MTHAPGRLAATPRTSLLRPERAEVEWRIADGIMPYDEAVAFMEARVTAIAEGEAREMVWLVEHPPLYTAGTSADTGATTDLPFPLHRTGRGGRVTYHGPGQRVAYVMLDLRRRGPDVRIYVAALERWIIDTLAAFNITGEQREDRVGVWVLRPNKKRGFDGAPAEDKIAAIGIRIRRWVTFHGISLNVEPDLSRYAAITPCGISAAHLGVTSLADLGHVVSMTEVDSALAATFMPIFGPISRSGDPLVSPKAIC